LWGGPATDGSARESGSDGPHGASGNPYPLQRLRLSLPSKAGAIAIIEAMSTSVLVVDDDVAFRGLARRVLTAGGLVVVGEAGSVAAAIAAALALRPCGALVDVGLPDGNGIALARELAALPWHPHVVLTSTDPEAASAADVRECSANGFVPKEQLVAAPLTRLLTR
jgi:CheY-like chemotaxis protein